MNIFQIQYKMLTNSITFVKPINFHFGVFALNIKQDRNSNF